MMLDWIARMYHGIFGTPAEAEHSHGGDISKCPFHNTVAEFEEVKQPVAETKPEPVAVEAKGKYHEFDRAFKKFNARTDIVVLSQEYVDSFDDIYKQKLESLGEKVAIFPTGMLVKDNVAIVTCGYLSYTTNNGYLKA